MADEMAEETKKLIQSVITSSPETVTIVRLKRDFRNLVGYEIPFRRLGYESLELYLLSLSETITVRGRGPDAIVKAYSTEKSAHVENLIAHQKKNSGYRNSFRGPPRYGHFYRPHHHNSRQFGGSTAYPPSPPPGFYNMRQPQFHATPLMSIYCFPPRSGDDRQYTPRHAHSTPTQVQYPHEQRPYVPNRTINNESTHNLTQVTAPSRSNSKVHVNWPSATDVEDATASAAAAEKRPASVMKAIESLRISPISLENFIPSGVESSSDDMNNLSEEEEIYIDSDDEIPPQTAVRNSDDKGCTSTPVVTPSTVEYNIRVPRDVQDNLIELITEDERNEGIWCGRLPDIYKGRFGSILSAEKYNFPSLLAMCLELPNIFYCIQIRRGDYKVFDRRKPFPKDTVKLNTFVRKVEDINTTSLVQAATNKSPLPEDHMSDEYFAINDQIPRLDVSSILSESDIADVRVTEVYDPSKFWLHLVGPEYSDKLNNMMDEMQEFYREKEKILPIPKEKMHVGLLCCAPYSKEYHRAVIIDANLMKPHLVKVFFVDYGTVCKVQLAAVLYLHRQFGSLPQQALRARLAGVYPREAKTPWSRTVARRFLELTTNRQLIAQVDKINGKRQEMDIFLIDTSSDDDLHIPDKLVEEGLAIFTHEEQEPVHRKWCFEPIVQYIHLYPTFREIETGRVHNMTEMGQLEELHVPYYIAYKHYFCQKEETESFANVDLDEVPADVVSDILESTMATAIDTTANWVENIDNSNVSDIVSITDIDSEPLKNVIVTECDGAKFLIIRYNNRVHLIVQQVLNYFKKELSIIQVRRLCVHLGIRIPCLTKRCSTDLYLVILRNEYFHPKEDAIHLLQVEDVPVFYEKISSDVFSLNSWPNIEKLLNFSCDLWVK